MSDIPENQTSISDADLERAYRMWKAGETYIAISKVFGVADRSVARWKKTYKWEERKQKEMALQIKHETQTELFIANDSLKTTNNLLNKIVLLLEEACENTTDAIRLRPVIKDYVASLDKIIRLRAFMDHGGADMSKNHNTSEKMDWNKLIDTSLKMKREHGKDFDDKKFVEDAINARFKKK